MSQRFWTFLLKKWVEFVTPLRHNFPLSQNPPRIPQVGPLQFDAFSVLELHCSLNDLMVFLLNVFRRMLFTIFGLTMLHVFPSKSANSNPNSSFHCLPLWCLLLVSCFNQASVHQWQGEWNMSAMLMNWHVIVGLWVVFSVMSPFVCALVHLGLLSNVHSNFLASGAALIAKSNTHSFISFGWEVRRLHQWKIWSFHWWEIRRVHWWEIGRFCQLEISEHPWIGGWKAPLMKDWWKIGSLHWWEVMGHWKVLLMGD